MNIPPSESSVRHRALKIAETHYRLSKHPHLQAETIARHYISLATTAQHLLTLVETRRHNHSGDNTDLDQAIDFMVNAIKTAHAHSLGIELDWSKL